MKYRVNKLVQFFCSVSLFACVTRTPSSKPIEGFSEEVVENFVSKSFHNRGGVQVGIIRDGQTIFLKSFGQGLDVGFDKSLKNEHFMHTASLTKQFTGWAVAQLIAEGRMKLSDGIEKFIDVPTPLAGITIAELLGHTHGLQSPDNLLDVYGLSKNSYDNKDALQLIFQQKTRDMSKQGVYGNAGYNLLAEIIAKVSKSSYKEYLQRNVLLPAGMSGSRIVDDCRSLPDDVVPSFIFDAQFKEHRQRYFTCFEGSIGLKSNAVELSKWMSFVMSEAQSNSKTYQIFSTQISLVQDGGLNRPYAMGVNIEEPSFGNDVGTDNANSTIGIGKGKAFSHSGSLFGYQHFILYYPAQKFGVVVLSNASSTDSELLGRNLAKYTLSRDESLLYQTQQVCDSEQAEYLSGLYPFTGHSQNINLVTDGRCLWRANPGQLVSVTEAKDNPGIYRVGNGINLVEATDHGLRKNARKLILNGKYKLTRAANVSAHRFPVIDFLGDYEDSRGEIIEIVLENDRPFLKSRDSLNELLWSGDQYLRTDHPIFEAIRFIFAKDGEILGLKYSMSGVQSNLFRKLETTKRLDALDVGDEELPQEEVNQGSDDEAIEKIVGDMSAVRVDPISAPELYVSALLARANSFSKTKERHIEIPVLYSIRGMISQIENRLLSSEQRKGIRALDERIAELIGTSRDKVFQPTLGWVLFHYFKAPLSGETDFNSAMQSIQNIWFMHAPAAQLDFAKSMSLWSPVSAHRIARHAMKLGEKERGEKFLKELFSH